MGLSSAIMDLSARLVERKSSLRRDPDEEPVRAGSWERVATKLVKVTHGIGFSQIMPTSPPSGLTLHSRPLTICVGRWGSVLLMLGKMYLPTLLVIRGAIVELFSMEWAGRRVIRGLGLGQRENHPPCHG
ncbi:hypothetical protein FNV43_RR00514 [Rhamnella rubrinervis]|uniref:Uncharacterized protein n=1 Tax=Rhamnella rubrinervis TaxID=2594499 RepID=A0A8K0MRH2_9ROSA|nr:hypothetical protein FNV43_RR00514 [Rhamnella rubrinervis]